VRQIKPTVDAAYLAHAIEDGFKSFSEVPLRDGVEYTQHRVLVEVVDGHDLKVTHEARRYVIAPAAWRSHRADEHLDSRHTIRSFTSRP